MSSGLDNGTLSNRPTRTPPLTVSSTFISRKIGEAPVFRQIGGCLAKFLQVWSYLSPGIFDEK